MPVRQALFRENFDLFDSEGNLLKRFRDQACFAALLAYRPRNNVKQVVAHFWHWNKSAKEEDLMEYVNTFIIPSCPVKVKEAFSIEQIEFDGTLYPPLTLPEGQTCRTYGMEGEVGEYWASLVFDATKISTNDMYIVCMLFRNAQESPDFAAEYCRLLKEYDGDFNKAFLFAHVKGYISTWSHATIHYNSGYKLRGGASVEGFNFGEIWKDKVSHAGSYASDSKKHDMIQNIFNFGE